MSVITRRTFLAGTSVAATATLAACGTSGGESASAGSDGAGAGSPVLDSAAWQYNADDDVYYQLGISYCASPASEEYEQLAVFVPGAYFEAKDNGDGTFTCTPSDAKAVGDYTASTAPIVMPVNTPGYSAQAPLTEYTSMTTYTSKGFVYAHAGCRGRDAGAPAGVVDLKAAVRFLRAAASSMAGSVERIFTFGMSGGGAQSALMGATGDSPLYQPYLTALGAAEKSDAIFGSMDWCPITGLDVGDEAYEWMMGATREGLSDEEQAISDELAKAFATYVNEAGIADESGASLSLEESDEGIFQAGSYSNRVVQEIEASLNNFLQDTEFPYDASAANADGPGMGGPGGPGGAGGPGAGGRGGMGGPGGTGGPGAGGALPSGAPSGADDAATPNGTMETVAAPSGTADAATSADSSAGGSTASAADVAAAIPAARIILPGTGSEVEGTTEGAARRGAGGPDVAVEVSEQVGVVTDENSSAADSIVAEAATRSEDDGANDANGSQNEFERRDNIARQQTSGGVDVSGTYETVADYIAALNADGEWVTYDEATNTATITSVAAFCKALKVASKSLGAFDQLDRGQGENTLFGLNGTASHFDATLGKILEAQGNAYATDFASDLQTTDAQGNDVQTRVNMYTPLYYLLASSEGHETSTPAKHWRIRSGINQGDTALTTELNLALALKADARVESVDFAAVWGQGHTMAERTGTSDENFIAWVADCLK